MITIAHCTYSNTIRQMPENYVLAHYENGCWKMEPDLASNKEIVVALTLSLMEYENKYSETPVFAMVDCASRLDDNILLSFDNNNKVV